MTDWTGSLARAFARHLEIGGSSGSTGSREGIARNVNNPPSRCPGTTSLPLGVPAVPSPHAAGLGTPGTSHPEALVPRRQTLEASIFRDMKDAGTSGTTGTGEIENMCPPSDIVFDAEPDSEFEERAAVIENGTRAPADWVEGFARLNVARRPKGFSQAQWEQVLDDGGRFLDGGWAEKAAEAGWSAKDVFGVHPFTPNARYDAMGLVPLMRGGEIIDLTPCRATIRTLGGNCLTYYLRRKSSEAIALWEVGNEPEDMPKA
jgi:hypothetical protein